MEKEFQNEIEFIKSVFPQHNERKKNPLDHSLRVGQLLFETGCSQDVIRAGLLHDAIEWTDADPEDIKDRFGDHVLEIILANTKDRNITDPVERRKDYTERCAEVGLDALLVKGADVLDSYRFYSQAHDEAELDRSKQIISLVLDALDGTQHPLIDKLQTEIK